MKAVLIIYNQALTEKVEFMLDTLEIRGFTRWENILGRGSSTGNPHMGTHTWPEFNSSTLAITEEDKVSILLESVRKLDSINETVGIRAFVWEVQMSV